jgi:tmRNA-binding protein
MAKKKPNTTKTISNRRARHDYELGDSLLTGIELSGAETKSLRMVLAKRREINALIEAKQQGRTIVPLEVLTRGRFIKVRIAVGKGKKHYDKRQTLKARDDARRAAAEMKGQR